MFRYAEIDENGIVFAVSFISVEVDKPTMILIPEDFDISNKKYVNGKWVEYIPEATEPEYQPTNAEIAQTQLTMMEAMADQYEQNLQSQLTNMEVQATIYETLLEVQGGITV